VAAPSRNITLFLPADLIRRARRVALDRDVSLSALVRELLEEAVRDTDDYEVAKAAALATLKRGYDLGTGGQVTWTREDLHERR